MPNQPMTPEGLRVVFNNVEPEDKEWSAHVKILNEWQNPERMLRDIIQYARSGPFYPADMHVDLIEQYIAQHDQQRLDAALAALPKPRDMNQPGYHHFNNALQQSKAALTAALAPNNSSVEESHDANEA